MSSLQRRGSQTNEKRKVLLMGFGGVPFLSHKAYTDIEVFQMQRRIVWAVTEREEKAFTNLIHKMHEDFIPFAFEASQADKWGEGVLLCEHEIDRRRLNQQEPKERFIL